MKSGRPRTHYDTLRVARDASEEEVRRAYRKLAQQYHPDRHPSRDASAGAMADINSAYGILYDADRRAQYDADLAEQEERKSRASERIAAVDVPTVNRSSWMLLIVIAAFAFTTLAFVALYTAAPKQVVPQHRASQPAAAIDNTPLAPLPPIEAWKQPPPRAAVPEDPVQRLVREGVVSPSTR